MEPTKGNALVRVATESSFSDITVTALERAGEARIPVAHLGAALGYAPKALPNAIRKWERAGLIRPEHIDLIPRDQVAQLGDHPDLDTTGRTDLLTLTERGVYRVLTLSRQPKALAFQDWFEGEVLPSIRGTGGYGVAPTPSLEERAGRFMLETAWCDPNRASIVARVMRAMKQGATGVSGIALLAKMKQGNVRFALMEAERHGLVWRTQHGYELAVGEPSAPLVIDELARNLLGGGR